VKEDALGRIHAEPLEQFRVPERKLDHFAERVDGAAHPSKVVISYIRAPFAGLAVDKFRQKLDGGLRIDVDNALGSRGHHHQPHFLECECGRVEHLPDGVGNVGIHPLMACRRNRIALA
jgi:hypothetical protein